MDKAPEPHNRLHQALVENRARHTVVVTGAGISHASGIPTFRGDEPDAVWKRDVTELGTYQYFLRDPVGSWRWYLSRFDGVLTKQPNPAHTALAALEGWQRSGGGQLTLITQNVDTLHENAGSKNLIKVHGSADRVRCVRMGCRNGAPEGSILRDDASFELFYSAPSQETLPRCPLCRSFLRQHVLWFDEFYDGHHDYQWAHVQHAAQAMDLVIFVGTSFSVGVTDLFAQTALTRQIAALSIDPVLRTAPYPGIELLTARSETLLPEVVAMLGVNLPIS